MSLKGQEWTVSWMKSYKAHLKKEKSKKHTSRQDYISNQSDKLIPWMTKRMEEVVWP